MLLISLIIDKCDISPANHGLSINFLKRNISMKASMTVNGTAYEHDVEPRTLLVHHLRENMGLTGTHVGCDTSSCGACTILVNGETAKSCTLLAVQCDGAKIKTIEGMASPDGGLHPIQESFREKHGCSVDSVLQVWLCHLGNCWIAIRNHQKMK